MDPSDGDGDDQGDRHDDDLDPDRRRSATKTDGSTQFRAVVTNSAGTATTHAVTPIVVDPAGRRHPAGQPVGRDRRHGDLQLQGHR